MVVIFIIALLALSSYEVCSFTFNRVSNLSVLGKSCFQLEHSNVILYGSGKPVEVTFQPSGKVIMAEQGDKIEDIAKKNGVNIPFKCKQGRCGSCEIRLNGRVSAKVCQGALIPSGPTKKIAIQVMNNKPI